ncbi:unnamed protein product [Diamesa tonsa]
MHHKNNDFMHSITMDQSPDVTMESDQNNNNENSNNNLSIKKNEKYSLRQRGQRKSITNKQSKSISSSNNNKASKKNGLCDDYMPPSKANAKVPKEKPKQRAAPLSKYRRKTANARERTRMREINTAFESLRQSVPVAVAGSPAQTTNEKLTKITTLRMAMKYIRILDDILDNKAIASESLMASLMETDPNNIELSQPEPEPEPVKINVNTKSKEKSNNSTVNNSVLIQNHHDYCKEVARDSIVRPVKVSKVTSKKTSKINSKPKRPLTKPSTKSQKKSPSIQKQQIQQPLAPPIIVTHQPHQQLHHSLHIQENKFINQLMESDGESLQLSEPCFSPLELGLLLESDGESLHLSEPCLSPLNHLDALNSFNDLLHTGFNEHNSLEMYLS